MKILIILALSLLPLHASVRAINAAGLVSPMSTPLVIRSVWSEVEVSVEFSSDLKTWSESFTPAARFARAKIRTPL